MANVKIQRFKKAHVVEAVKIWRKSFPFEALHAHGAWNPSGGPMTKEKFEKKILSRKVFDSKGGFVALIDGRVVGFCFAVASVHKPVEEGWLVALAVAPRARRQGIGSSLINKAEAFLKGRGAKDIHAGFIGNPMTVLGGVPLNEDAYSFFLNRKYRNWSGDLLQVMTQDATKYKMEQAMRDRIKKLKGKGIWLGLLQSKHHKMFDQFLVKNFQGWRGGIMNSLSGANPRDVIVAIRKRSVLGYSGPFSMMKSGTGTFNSVGVAKAARGLGVGAAVFNMMCEELTNRGASIVSLTTDINNPAQEIYARTGYRAQFIIDYKMKKKV